MSPRYFLIIMYAACVLGGCKEDQPKPAATQATPQTQPAKAQIDAPKSDVIEMFDGKTLKNWQASEFGGEGEVRVEDGAMIIKDGATLSGITWKGPELPTMDYEITLDAMKKDGSDFFCGLTFPVGKSYASLILGGWGGNLVGISSINGFDAANNETATAREFKKGQWYKVTMRVTPKKLEAWLDEDKIVDLETEDKEISTRSDIDAAKPFGISTYQTTSAVKNLRIKKLAQ